jgi:hypothetical protein
MGHREKLSIARQSIYSVTGIDTGGLTRIRQGKTNKTAEWQPLAPMVTCNHAIAQRLRRTYLSRAVTTAIGRIGVRRSGTRPVINSGELRKVCFLKDTNMYQQSHPPKAGLRASISQTQPPLLA